MAIVVHGFDGGFYEKPGFYFNECLYFCVCVLGDERVCCLGLDDVVNEIGIGKQSHIIEQLMKHY